MMREPSATALGNSRGSTLCVSDARTYDTFGLTDNRRQDKLGRTKILAPDHHAAFKSDSRKVDGQSNRDVPDDRDPSHDIRNDRCEPRRRQLERPIVQTPRDWVRGSDLSERDGDANVDKRHDDPIPDRDDRPTIRQWVD